MNHDSGKWRIKCGRIFGLQKSNFFAINISIRHELPPLGAVCRDLGQFLSSSRSFVGKRLDPIYSDILSIVWLVLVKTVPVECDSLTKLLNQNISLEVRYLSHNFL